VILNEAAIRVTRVSSGCHRDSDNKHRDKSTMSRNARSTRVIDEPCVSLKEAMVRVTQVSSGVDSVASHRRAVILNEAAIRVTRVSSGCHCDSDNKHRDKSTMSRNARSTRVVDESCVSLKEAMVRVTQVRSGVKIQSRGYLFYIHNLLASILTCATIKIFRRPWQSADIQLVVSKDRFNYFIMSGIAP
jgi:hypothetical protein